MSPLPDSRRTVPVWDLPTRIFHWLLVALIFLAWVSFEFSETFEDPRLVWHRWNGLALLTLIVWRILWGFAGPKHARFSAFVRGPSALAGYARVLARGTPPHFLGHNPLGGWVVVFLIGLVGAIGTLGLFALEHNDNATGPLYRYAGEAWAKVFTSWHRFLFERILLVLIAVHVAANLYYQFVRKEPLIGAMITGRKPAGDYADAASHAAEDIEQGYLARAFFILIAAKIVVFGSLYLLGGRLPPWPAVM